MLPKGSTTKAPIDPSPKSCGVLHAATRVDFLPPPQGADPIGSKNRPRRDGSSPCPQRNRSRRPAGASRDSVRMSATAYATRAVPRRSIPSPAPRAQEPGHREASPPRQLPLTQVTETIVGGHLVRGAGQPTMVMWRTVMASATRIGIAYASASSGLSLRPRPPIRPGRIPPPTRNAGPSHEAFMEPQRS
jgi:hypothetical protein